MFTALAAQHVAVVISSTWREVYPLRRLIAAFSDDIQPRIIGATPVFGDGAIDYLRYREIQAWLKSHPEISRWVALDDAVEDFPLAQRANVVFTDPDIALVQENIKLLRSLVEQF